MGRIFLVRHGETTANRERILQGPRIDAGLSDVGMLQAEGLGDALRRQGISVLYSSPLLRARQTAEAVSKKGRDLAVQIVPELYEMDYGELAGRNYDAVQDTMEQVLDAWKLGFVEQTFPGGESPIIAQHRVGTFARRVTEQARERDVAVVGHGRINRILLATWTGAGLTRLEEFPQSNASISEVEVGQDGVFLRRLNDTSHLDIRTDTVS
jgi:broad specificity phosphatase PhoE